MSIAAAEALRKLEELGASLTLDGKRIRVTYKCPPNLFLEIKTAIAIVKEHKEEAIACLELKFHKKWFSEQSWPQASLDSERKFRHIVARLYPFLHWRVRTPKGMGTLLQVFKDRAMVLLDAELTKPTSLQQATFFAPEDVCPPGIA